MWQEYRDNMNSDVADMKTQEQETAELQLPECS